MTSSQRTSIQLALLAFAAVLFTSVVAFAETYTLTARTEPQQTGVNGLPEGKSYCDLTSSDTLIVTATGAQLYFNRSANLVVPITISGFGDGTGAYHATGKFRMQNSGTVVNLNGLVTLAGDTFIGSHSTTGNQGTLNFNNQITGSGGLITCIGTNGYVHLNNTSPNLNNYQGNTQLGYPEMYNYNSYRPYAGVVYLDANEQIPDALTAGSSATGNLVMNSYTFDNGNSIDNQISKLYLGNHTETVNGLVSADTGTALSIITGENNSKLIVGANNATASYSGLLQGAMQLEKIGTGTQTLSGANTYTGATTITAGTLKLTGDGSLGTGSVTNNATLEFGSDNAATVSNNISGSGNVTKTGTGTLTVSGTNAYSGGTAINAGTLKLTNSATMGTGTATVASGATVEIGTASNTAWTWDGGTINGAGTLKVTGGGEFSMPLEKMQINTNGSLIVDGAKLTLTNPTTNYPGKNIYINNGGTLAFDRTTDSYAGIYFNNTLNVNFDKNGGGTLQTGDKGNSYMNLISNSQITFTTNGGATNYITGTNGFNTHHYNLNFDVAKGTSANGVDLDVSARIWNSKGIIKNGDGTLAITGNNTDDNGYSGGTTINAGTLKLTGAGTMGTGVVSIASGATLTFASDLTQTTIANPISGAGKIVKEGTNTVNLNGRLNGNTNPSYSAFTGNVDIKGGTLSVRMNGSSNNFSATNLSGSGNLELRLASGTGDSRLPNLTYNSATPFTGVISLVSEGGANGNKINTGNRSFAGFTFVVNSGTSLYAESGTFAGNVKIYGDGNTDNRGALRLATNMSGIITVMDNAGIAFNGSPTVSGNISSGAATGESVTLFINGKTDGTTKTSSDNPGTFTGAISDGTSGSTLGINIRYNTQTFSGALSYTGATTIHSQGTMVLSGANANLDDSSAVTVNGTLNFAGYTGASANTGLDVMQRNIMQLNNLSGTNGVIVGTGKDLILNNDEMTKFIGSITAKEIVKTGDGTLQIYTGATGQVDAQSLVVSSGNLDFKGYMTGGITVDANAVFSPGNSVGEATFGGGYILNDGATLLIEQDATGMDKLTASSFEIHPNSILDLTLGSVQSGEYVILEQKNGDAPVDFGIVTIGGQTYDYSDASFWNSLLSEDDAYFWNLSVSGNKVMATLDANAVPEPSTWALMILGVVVLFLRKRVRN